MERRSYSGQASMVQRRAGSV